mgnify:CR=1 FL=1
MINDIFRKSRQVVSDPVLRRWIIARLTGREKKPAHFTPGQPPYLNPATPDENIQQIEDVAIRFPRAEFDAPRLPLTIALPGEAVDVAPDRPFNLFTRKFSDLETELAVHRFAWVPVAAGNVDTNWVATLWACWTDLFGDQRTGWAWHAYTAAERAINIIDFSQNHGAPSEPYAFCAMLARHAEIIIAGLEYFGDHNTSNHLSNNGRGLLRIGVAIGDGQLAETGSKIMVSEAGRIFERSGVLREGSTHYHLLLTRNYLDAADAAERASLHLAGTLRKISERALAVIPGLCLSGGLPLIGDISPDVPPKFLDRLYGSKDQMSWPGNLSADRCADIVSFIGKTHRASPEELARDGWHKFGGHDWQALTYLAPNGWPQMPGHGHKDLCSFELHYGNTRVVVDPGRGSYADSVYENADVHNGILVDGILPIPENKPYYSDDFRRALIPAPPAVTRARDGMVIAYRVTPFSQSVQSVSRQWSFAENAVTISDRINGSGKHSVRRQFIVPGKASVSENGAEVEIDGAAFRFDAGVPGTILECTQWEAYGVGSEATKITFDEATRLPYEGKTIIEKRQFN